MTHFIHKNTHTQTHALSPSPSSLSLSLSLSPSLSLSSSPPFCPVSLCETLKKCSVVFFFLYHFLSILSYPILSCPYLRHFLRRISLPAPISRIYLFLSFHRQISSPLTLYHCRCFKKPIVFMCISISYVTMYLFEPLHSSFTCPIFFLRAGVFLCFFFLLYFRGKCHRNCAPACGLGYTCHIPSTVLWLIPFSKHLFLLYFFSSFFFFTPCYFFQSPS